jgi:hypothetical protein
MPTPDGIIADGPLTIEPAKTVEVPAVYTTDQFGRFESPPLQDAGTVTRPVVVSISNRPDKSDGSTFIVDGPKDMGSYFTQEQIQSWYELKRAIEEGSVTATVTGTVPWQPGP